MRTYASLSLARPFGLQAKKWISSQLAHVVFTRWMSSPDAMIKIVYRLFRGSFRVMTRAKLHNPWFALHQNPAPDQLQQQHALPSPQQDHCSRSILHSTQYASITSAKFSSKNCHVHELFEKVACAATWGRPCVAVKDALSWFVLKLFVMRTFFPAKKND